MGDVLKSLVYDFGSHADMGDNTQENESPSTTLCKACGLCCSGHLFFRAELRLAETETTQALGLNVLQSSPETPAFSQPCPLWKGECTIYAHPHKPSICSDFRCKLLREVVEGQLHLDEALLVVQRTKHLIQELDDQLAAGPAANFRKHLFEHLEQLERVPLQTEAGNRFRLKAGSLLVLYTQRFGEKGLFNRLEQEKSAQG